MKRIPSILPSIFLNRRLVLVILAATALVGTPLFLLFPPPATAVRLLVTGSAVRGGGKLRDARVARTGRTGLDRYLTLNPGETVDLSPGPVSFGDQPRILSRVGTSSTYRAVQAGHTVVSLGAGKTRRNVYVFVSPIASKHVGREDVDWYRTQWGTGEANCGPAVVSMSILWARKEDYTVEAVREEIGWPYEDGATSYDDLQAALQRHGVRYSAPELSSPRELMDVLDRGHIAIVLIQDGDISMTAGDPSVNMVGRYYDDDEGHYILVKGYSLDERFFVVYDSYPVDWESNGLRYADGTTMIGKNRYYYSAELFAALKTRTVIEVFPGT